MLSVGLPVTRPSQARWTCPVRAPLCAPMSTGTVRCAAVQPRPGQDGRKLPLSGKTFPRCASVSRSSPERAETGYGIGEAKRNRATVPASPGDAISFRNANNGNQIL